MGASELRMGNYLLITDINQLVSVTEITKEYIHYDSKTRFGKAIIEYFKPIPITEEWLLKFGFAKGVDNIFHIKSKHLYLKLFPQIGHVLGSVNKYSHTFKISEDIKSVHQLQNLYFALTQNELTIKK